MLRRIMVWLVIPECFIRGAETPDAGRSTLVLVNLPVATNMRRNDGLNERLPTSRCVTQNKRRPLLSGPPL